MYLFVVLMDKIVLKYFSLKIIEWAYTRGKYRMKCY